MMIVKPKNDFYQTIETTVLTMMELALQYHVRVSHKLILTAKSCKEYHSGQVPTTDIHISKSSLL